MNIIVLTSGVPKHNASPVAVHKKMLNMCNQAVEYTTFICANYPEEQLKEYYQTNFKYFDLKNKAKGNSRKADIISYIKAQFEIPKLIKRAYSKGSYVMFWLAGPMILPFLYCKIKDYKTIGFLYGNTRLKSDKKRFINSLVAVITEFIAKRSNYTCVEANGVAKHWGYNPETDNINVVHLYVDTNKFKVNIPYEDRKKIVGMSCRLVDSKKILESIKAFAAIEDEFPDWKLEIAGDGFLYETIQKLIEDLDQKDRIKLLGWVNNGDMPYYYNRWQFLLNPTNYEGLPNSVLESMACGSPILSSKVGGIEDVLKPNNGWELKEKTVEAIEDQLRSVIKEQKRKEKSGNAVDFIATNYNFDASTDNFKEFISKINQ